MRLENLIIYKDKFISKLVADKKSVNTINNYSSILEDLIIYARANAKNEDFNLKDIVLDYIESLDSSYSVNTLNTKRSAIRSFINYLYKRGYIDTNFKNDIENLRLDTGKQKIILTSDEIKAVIKLLNEELSKAKGYNIFFKARNRMLFIMLLYTGVRRTELVNIKWSDIDTINNKIKVLGKGNKTRIIPLVKELKFYIYEYKEIIERLINEGYNIKSEYVFPTNNRGINKPMTSKNVEIIINSIIKKAGIQKHITPHTLRHNFASYGLKNKMSIPVLSAILGHSSPDITMKVYAHEISFEQRKSEMQKLNFGINTY